MSPHPNLSSTSDDSHDADATLGGLLLVEDGWAELELELVALRELAAAGRVTVARDGAEAIELLFGADPIHPGLIVLDLHLPKIDGVDVLRRVKQDPATSAIPVAIFTSSLDADDRSHCLALGADAYVVKPVGYAAFQAAVRVACAPLLGPDPGDAA
jgi:two-component system, response regulator